MEEIVHGVEALRAAIDKEDVTTAQAALNALKLKMISLASAMPRAQMTAEAARELSVVRQVYEEAIRLNVLQQDSAAFERHMAHLKPLYFEYASVLEPSPQMTLVIGLNLMRLLAQNRIAEFHTEIELLPEDVKQDPFVHYAMSVEQNLMVGSYTRIIATRSAVPDSSFVFFLDMLLKTIRDDLAECIEKAYQSLDLPFAKQVLMIPQDDDMIAYCQAHGWTLDGNRVIFDSGERPAVSLETSVPTIEIMKRSIAYAKELERIV
ncbi:26S proteasome non-ATPase regulatory subunit 8-like A [Porphyridium purpureum]|uniref:26S proteasome non-ATPase regulatory subunit 8-like A n=1 Tax=Porphyridium purpureum TaxID=35688 RepID=A0A5J4YV57_PORPP|nr:26S proteasome non-ATPase regulatory subunit 8-like A [Porphyridium purpureum]|eukprot:POR5192..scf209_3